MISVKLFPWKRSAPKHSNHSDFFWISISFFAVGLVFVLAIALILIFDMRLTQTVFYLLFGGAMVSDLVGIIFIVLNIIC